MTIHHSTTTMSCTCHDSQAIRGRVCNVCTGERVEELLDDVRGEIGNAGLAVAVGKIVLANEALIEAIGQIEVVREHLAGQS